METTQPDRAINKPFFIKDIMIRDEKLFAPAEGDYISGCIVMKRKSGSSLNLQVD